MGTLRFTDKELIGRLRYQGKQYSKGQTARGGGIEDHYLTQAANRLEALTADAETKLASARHDFCYCNDDCSLQMVSGGGSKEGLYGVVTLKIDGQYVPYVPAEAKLTSMEPVACSTAVEVKLPEKLPLTEKVTGYPLSPGRSNFVEGYNYALDKISSLGKLYTTPQPAPDVQAAVAAALEKAANVSWDVVYESTQFPEVADAVQEAVNAISRDTSALDEYKADIKRLVDLLGVAFGEGNVIRPTALMNLCDELKAKYNL